jgi:MoaA/NifB/PqqE/SkfB family radical SAM enzyme
MRKTERITRSNLDEGVLKDILDAASVKGVQAVSFTGGEPLLFQDEIIELMMYAGSLGIPYIRTGTNGFLFRHSDRHGFTDRIKRLADRLAGTPVRNFWISLDAADAGVHEEMRGFKGVVAGIEKSLPIFHAAGLYPSANLGINRWVDGDSTRLLRPAQYQNTEDYLDAFYCRFRRAFHRFYRFVCDLGFTIVNACYPMSVGYEEKNDGLQPVYAATSTDRVVHFTRAEKRMLYKALMDTIPAYRRRLRIFSPLSSLYMLMKQYEDHFKDPEGFGCRGGVDFFFINVADGNTYPCGYRGTENLGPFQQLDLSALKPHAGCHLCDWECFRDPSELCAPLLQLLHAPLKLARRFYKHPAYLKHWFRDILYYRACDLFDGRKPLDASKLNCF